MRTSDDFYQGYESWKGWDELFSYDGDKADYFAGEMNGIRIRNAEVLEIGFGSGDFLQWASDQGAAVTGTEINPVLLTAAEAKGVTLLAADIENIADSHRERFDTIVAFDVFEHFMLNDVVLRLAAAETMLKPGGHLVMRFPNAQSPFGLAPQNGDPTHRSCLSRSVFEQLLQESSLKIVRYAPSFRAAGRTWPKRIARFVRHGMQDAISASLNFVYASRIPWAPVVVLVLAKLPK